jgi:hypothetical protein
VSYQAYSADIVVIRVDLTPNITLTPDISTPSAYTVSGTVRSGSSSGPAVPGVQVSLTNAADTPAVSATAMSNSSGAYSFHPVPNGSYTLSVPAEIYGGESYQAYSANITVNDGNVTHSITLTPDISTPSAYTVSGTVRSGSSSSPVIPGVQVSLTNAPGTPAFSATTDASGNYSIPSVPDGSYIISAVLAGTYGGVSYQAYSAAIVVSSVDVTRNISLTPDISTPSAYTVSGTVRSGSSSGPAIPGVQVSLTDAAGTPAFSATTDENGDYSITSVPDGDYTLSVPTVTYGGVKYQAYSAAITVSGGDVSHDIVLTPDSSTPSAYTVSGTVRSGSSSGPAIPDVQVSLTDAAGTPAFSATTDASGNYSIPSVPDGSYIISAVLAGTYGGVSYQAYSANITVNGVDVTRNIRLTPDSSTPSAYTVSGTVRSSTTGYAIPDVQVSLTDAADPEVFIATAKSDAIGDYSIPPVPDGSYIISASSGEYGVKYQAYSAFITVNGGNVSHNISLIRLIPDCFIATSIYGGDAPETDILRAFRDNTLAKSGFGQAFVNVYYAVSPVVVTEHGGDAWFAGLFQPVLDNAVDWLRSNNGELSAVNMISFATYMYGDANAALADLKALVDAGEVDIDYLLSGYTGDGRTEKAIIEFIRSAVKNGGVGLGDLIGFINPPTHQTDSSSGSDSGGGSSTRDSFTPSMPAAVWWIEAPEAKTLAKTAKDNALDYARSRRGGSTGIRAAALAELAGLRFEHDTVAGGAVQVRISIGSPAKITKDTLLSGSVQGDAVGRTRTFFEKWFTNKVRAVHLDHTGAWGQPVKIAARTDLTGMDITKLYFYSYNREANTYRRIGKPDYWIDVNGYLHFTTEWAGDIIVSEGRLTLKPENGGEK